MDRFAVIGGDGFLGHNLVVELTKRFPQASVTSLDVVQRYFPSTSAGSGSWTFLSTDLTDRSVLDGALAQVKPTTVFHTASPWIGSGAEVCEKVNVLGTQTVVDSCKHNGVKQLVFTSSAGVVYNAVDLINVDERLPVPEKPIDAYNDTKVSARSCARVLCWH